MGIFKYIDKSNATLTSRAVYRSRTLTTSSVGLKVVQYRSGSRDNFPYKYSESGSYWASLHTLFYSSGSLQYKKIDGQNTGSARQWWDEQSTLHSPNFHQNKFFTSGSIFSIPQVYFGETITPGTFRIIDNSTSKENTIRDDGYGNLYPVGNSISQSNTSPSSSDNYIGNVFYKSGIVTITDTGSYSSSIKYTDVGIKNYQITFQGSHILHTQEYVVSIQPQEFNSTMNFTARGRVSGSKHLEGSQVLYSPHLLPMLTGSGWLPYMTTIYLYSSQQTIKGDDIRHPQRQAPLLDPVIIAKVPRPIKMRDDVPITFRIRFDI